MTLKTGDTVCIKQVREKYYQYSQLSHIFINAPKQYIFNF